MYKCSAEAYPQPMQIRIVSEPRRRYKHKCKSLRLQTSSLKYGYTQIVHTKANLFDTEFKEHDIEIKKQISFGFGQMTLVSISKLDSAL